MLLETPIMADGYGFLSFVFQSPGTDSDTLPSALFTKTFPDDALVADDVLRADDVPDADDVLEADDLLRACEQPERMNVAEKSKATTTIINLIFFWFFKFNLQKSNI